MVYLNHAGTSWPKPAAVQRAVAEALAASPLDWPRSFARDRAVVARGFGIEAPSRLLLTPGCTSALAVAIADHPWAAGDRVVTSAWEHQALTRPVRQLAGLGVEHVVIPPADDGPLDLAALETVLRRGRVRLVALCAAANTTGALLPIEQVVDLAHAHGALVLVDAAQTAGWLALDVVELGIDLLAFAGHKGPQSPWGVGGLYVADGVTMTATGASCTVSAAAPCTAMPGYCDTGSVDRIALAGLVAGLRWLAEPERRGRLAFARSRVSRLAAVLAQLPAVTLFGPSDASRRMPTLAFAVRGRASSEVADALAHRGVVGSGGQQCAPLAHQTLGTTDAGLVRLSVGPSTTDSDIDAAIDALRAALAGAGRSQSASGGAAS